MSRGRAAAGLETLRALACGSRPRRGRWARPGQGKSSNGSSLGRSARDRRLKVALELLYAEDCSRGGPLASPPLPLAPRTLAASAIERPDTLVSWMASRYASGNSSRARSSAAATSGETPVGSGGGSGKLPSLLRSSVRTRAERRSSRKLRRAIASTHGKTGARRAGSSPRARCTFEKVICSRSSARSRLRVRRSK